MNLDQNKVAVVTPDTTASVKFHTFTAVAPIDGKYYKVGFYNIGDYATANTFLYWVALYKGPTAVMDWVPAPEDGIEATQNMQGQVDEATQNANEAKEAIAGMFSDDTVTPIEKQSLLREYQAIENEYNQLTSQATALGVTYASYTTAFNALNGTTPKIESEILADMGSNYTFANSSSRNTMNDKIANYFTEASKLRGSLRSKVNDDAQEAKENATKAKEEVNTMVSDSVVTPIEKQSLSDTVKSLKNTVDKDLTNTVTSVVDTVKSQKEALKNTADELKNLFKF